MLRENLMEGPWFWKAPITEILVKVQLNIIKFYKTNSGYTAVKQLYSAQEKQLQTLDKQSQ